MYTDILKYVTANERIVRRMKAREDFKKNSFKSTKMQRG